MKKISGGLNFKKISLLKSKSKVSKKSKSSTSSNSSKSSISSKSSKSSSSYSSSSNSSYSDSKDYAEVKFGKKFKKIVCKWPVILLLSLLVITGSSVPPILLALKGDGKYFITIYNTFSKILL